MVNGVTRTYGLHVPPNFQPNGGGLVIAFHAAGENGAEFEQVTKLSVKADQVGFAAVYPDGLTNPSGSTTMERLFQSYPRPQSARDSGFAQQLILTLEANCTSIPRCT